MHPLKHLSLLAMVITPVLAAGAETTTDRPPIFDDLLDKLLERQAQIQTVVCESTSDLMTWSPMGRQDTALELKVWRKGDSQAVAIDKQVSLAGQVKKYWHRSVLNPEYLAEAFNSTNDAKQFMHDGDPRRIPMNRLHLDANLLTYGFGDGFEPIRRSSALNARIARWDVEEEKDGTYHLLRFLRDPREPSGARSWPDVLWVVDPQKGYLITRTVFYESQGSIRREIDVTPQMIEGFGWFPGTVKAVDYLPEMSEDIRRQIGKKEDDKIVRVDRVKFRAVQINSPIPEQTFSLEFLQLRKNAMIRRIKLNGTEELLIYRFGKALPLAVGRAWSRLGPGEPPRQVLAERIDGASR